jgi:hypothetical protein
MKNPTHFYGVRLTITGTTPEAVMDFAMFYPMRPPPPYDPPLPTSTTDVDGTVLVPFSLSRFVPDDTPTGMVGDGWRLEHWGVNTDVGGWMAVASGACYAEAYCMTPHDPPVPWLVAVGSRFKDMRLVMDFACVEGYKAGTVVVNGGQRTVRYWVNKTDTTPHPLPLWTAPPMPVGTL